MHIGRDSHVHFFGMRRMDSGKRFFLTNKCFLVWTSKQAIAIFFVTQGWVSMSLFVVSLVSFVPRKNDTVIWQVLNNVVIMERFIESLERSSAIYGATTDTVYQHCVTRQDCLVIVQKKGHAALRMTWCRNGRDKSITKVNLIQVFQQFVGFGARGTWNKTAAAGNSVLDGIRARNMIVVTMSITAVHQVQLRCNEQVSFTLRNQRRIRSFLVSVKIGLNLWNQYSLLTAHRTDLGVNGIYKNGVFSVLVPQEIRIRRSWFIK